jgi:hypothetical protein
LGGEIERGDDFQVAILCTRGEVSHSMSCARDRAQKSEKKGTQKYTPLSSLKVSPFVRQMLEEYKKCNAEESEEIEVENSADNDYLVQCLLRTLKENEQLHGTFMGVLFAQQLACLSVTSGREGISMEARNYSLGLDAPVPWGEARY